MTTSGDSADGHPDGLESFNRNGRPEVTRKPSDPEQTTRPAARADAMAPTKRPHTAPAGAGHGHDAGRRGVSAAVAGEVPRASKSALIGGGSGAKETAVARAKTSVGKIGYYGVLVW